MKFLSRRTIVTTLLVLLAIVLAPSPTQSGGLSNLFKLARNLVVDGTKAGARGARNTINFSAQLGRREFNVTGGRSFNSSQTRFAASIRRESYLRTAATVSDDTKRSIDDVIARPIGTHAVYAAVPKDAVSFKKMFDVPATAKNMSEISSANRMLNQANFKIARASQSTDDLARFLKEIDAQIVSFIGHNNNGLLRISGNVSIKIEDLAAKCAASGRICVFFSCRAQDHLRSFKVQNGLGSKVDLNFEEAVRSVSKLDQAISSFRGRGKSVGDLVDNLPKIVDEAIASSKLRSKAELYVATGLVGGSTIVVIVSLDRNE